MGPFLSELFVESEFSKKSDPPAEPKLSQNFGQILTRALGLTTLSELHLEVVAPRFEEIYKGGREGRQQTSAFRHRRRSPTELGYRGECPTYRPLPVLSLSLSIWSGSAFRDVANFEISATVCW